VSAPPVHLTAAPSDVSAAPNELERDTKDSRCWRAE
jgi:hypothetical protein